MNVKVKNFVTPEKTKYHAEMLANRIRKRFAHLSKRFKREGIDCFRLYDWDIKEVRAVVDWYAGHVVIAEYERLQTGPDWLPCMAEAVAGALNLPLSRVHMKRRRTNVKEGPRYSVKKSSAEKPERFIVRERHLKFWVNLDDFLDTGLYSDHRDTRVMIGQLAKDKDFLNLFAYTGVFTCTAASGGAKTTTTVDRSGTYIQWAKDNMELNGLRGPQHTFIQSDVEKFLSQTGRGRQRFTLAFVDPPSFFQETSKGVAFDINVDHPKLLQNVLQVMAPGSTVFFSTNHQRFEPKLGGLAVKDLKEITPATIPEDYRNEQVHRCWQMTV
ncbi:MAG: SAM-dependent methyltransferase [Omnitrophica WOR_2 bacterium RIFCSPHIGHO2_01_FULL_48_9]|nr:MAG: SAM-dependent methyltransferase [Omnitrophica WOR_2 bacterium RIFCSPHIGHO2_01_FULL_48_9]